MAPLRVVVNADDLGLSRTVNDAVFAAVDAGLCTAASLLAVGPAVEDALRRARGRDMPVGVHLALTEMAPLTGGLRHLLAPDGTFGPRAFMDVGEADADAVLAEWAAQVDRVRQAGLVVDHLDSHQHVHHRPALRRVLAELCARVGVLRVRGMGAFRVAGAGTRVGRALQPLRAATFRRRLRADGLVTTDGFASVTAFLARARGPLGPMRGWRTIELMAHPGNSAHAVYAEEIDALARGDLERLPFEVRRIGWAEVT
ncbi:MAG: carbohydrate deacetylase [Myxococcota bacterium]